MENVKLSAFKVVSCERKMKEELKNHNYDKYKQIINKLNDEEKRAFVKLIKDQIENNVKEITELHNILDIYYGIRGY